MEMKSLRQKKTRPKHLCQSGYLLVPLVLALMMTALSGLGVWGLLRHWRFAVETQLRINRCLGEVAREFRDVLHSLESANQRIVALRASIVAASVQPWLIPSLEAALSLEVAGQDLIQMKWTARSLKWLVIQGCGHRGDVAMPLPQLKYNRPPPDGVGFQPLEWRGKMPDEFALQLQHSPRYAAAVVKENQNGVVSGKSSWIAVWSVPKKVSWTSSR
jgi:hypothetical protein